METCCHYCHRLTLCSLMAITDAVAVRCCAVCWIIQEDERRDTNGGEVGWRDDLFLYTDQSTDFAVRAFEDRYDGAEEVP